MFFVVIGKVILDFAVAVVPIAMAINIVITVAVFVAITTGMRTNSVRVVAINIAIIVSPIGVNIAIA